ncbi:MAG TPA: HAD-IC family P-type ATPase [Thermoplasmata archaeon]|nr:HAD-IC family P-type ATPase [Thermoplasmata archaeon]
MDGRIGSEPSSPTNPRAPLPRTSADGLSSDEVRRRRAVFGPNEVPEEPPHVLRRIAAQLWGPVPWMLELAFVLELVIRGYPSAAILAGLLVLNGLLSVSQEQRARSALSLLRQRLQILARVQRSGAWGTVPARELVPGDRLHLRMGDIVPADAHLEDGSVEVDQSMLTGESTSVSRGPSDTVYSGSVIRRGEATGEVTATGVRTYFGRTAELVRSAHARSHLQELMFRVVSYLIVVDAVLALLVVGDGLVRATNLLFLVPFLLILLIASVPVAMPATFTVASAIESRRLAEEGVLVTGLSAVEDAAGMDLLFSDKTGTLTQNRQTVTDVRPFSDLTSDQVLSLAAAACDESTQDPIDIAILEAARRRGVPRPERSQFVPFDPAAKRSEASIREGGQPVRVVLGAPAVIGRIASMPAELADLQDEWGTHGYRILAVGKGPEGALRTVGAVALADPIREEAPELIRTLHGLGIRVVMITGDGIATARAAGRSLGLDGPVGSREDLARASEEFAGFAGVYPEDKFTLVRALQGRQRIVGMTGDGVNDAPALRQAEVGVAVSNAMDVAKASAKLVLTRPGLEGIVVAVDGGRRVYRRMLTWMLNKVSRNIQLVTLLCVGFLVTGQLLTTPFLVLLMIFAGDFVTISVGTDRARISRSPDRWNVRRLVTLGVALAAGWLTLSLALLFVGVSVVHWPLPTLQTVVFLYLVFSGQATLYLVRERGPFWSSRPSPTLLVASALDLLVLSLLATFGVLMAPISPLLILALIAAVAGTAVALDRLKLWLFRITGEPDDRVPSAAVSA